MNNPFPLPDRENNLNVEILSKITTKLRNENLDFYYFLDNLKRCSENNNQEEYIIWAYYATNLILKDTNNYPTDDSKANIILDIQKGINISDETN